MRTVTFKSVLWGAARLLGMNPNRDLNSDRAATLTEYINRHVAFGWRFEFFPEWLLTEQRYYRPLYDAAEVMAAGDERYYPPADKYYQALQASTGELPATLTDGEYVENSQYWAECAQEYSGEDWASGTDQAVGDQVRNPADGIFYQCHTPHTAGASFDASKFGALTQFNQYIAWEQTDKTAIDAVKGCSRRDPRVFTTRPWPVSFEKSPLGVQLPSQSPTSVWLQFRTRPPVFDSTPYSASANVSIADVRYYATSGDCYLALQPQTPAAQAPTDTDYWTKVDFPTVLAAFVKRATQADTLRDQKQTARANAEMERAEEELRDQVDFELDQQGQYDRATVVVS